MQGAVFTARVLNQQSKDRLGRKFQVAVALHGRTCAGLIVRFDRILRIAEDRGAIAILDFPNELGIRIAILSDPITLPTSVKGADNQAGDFALRICRPVRCCARR